jgi:hypothetical protein
LSNLPNYLLDEVVSELNDPDKTAFPLPATKIRSWMSSADPEVLGATYSLVTKERHLQRIQPPLSFDEQFAFLLRYFEFCLTNNPEGKWIDNRFTAGSDFVSIFVSLWDEGRDKKYFQEMKSLLRRLYTGGPGELKDSIELAIVEHLFERPDIRKFFGDWQDDPQLRSAYEAGKLWAEGGGRSPLTQRRKL